MGNPILDTPYNVIWIYHGLNSSSIVLIIYNIFQLSHHGWAHGIPVDEAVIESHDVSSSDRQGVTSILWENTAKLFDATSIARSLIAHLGSFCDGHLSFRMSAIFKVQCKRRVDSVAASPREYLVRRPAKNVISPPNPPQKNEKQQCKNQECLAS